MKLFGHARTKRNTAYAMLLVWLFAIATGVSNACLLETHEPHNASQMSAATASHAHVAQVDHAAASAGHDEDAASTKELCLKACDDGTNTLLKAHSGVDHADPDHAPLVATLWTAVPPVVSALRRLDDLAIALFGPPFRVRYSRLLL